jgi:hypothetical protein
LYAGTPNASGHQALVTLGPGSFYEISGLDADEVVSLQGGSQFAFEAISADVPPEADPTPPEEEPIPEVPTSERVSREVTWLCTGSACPWGFEVTGHALEWPSWGEPQSSRFGYTTSVPIYLPSDRANGATIWIESGSASLYAGLPNASSHRFLAFVSAGTSHNVSGLAPGEVLSVQSDSVFEFQFNLGEPQPDPDPEPEPDPEPMPGSTNWSEYTYWDCAGTPCPWGQTTSTNALVWPASGAPQSQRLGYVTSFPIYLPQQAANGTTISILSGSATVYAGSPGASSHRVVSSIAAGGSYMVSGILSNEVISVQGSQSFSYELSFGGSNPPAEPIDLVYSERALWYCNTSTCTGPPWGGRVINWPHWAAYSSNNRAGDNSRTVYSADTGLLLYPYMGSWADGCQVTAHQGQVLVIEWQRGSNVWRETYIQPGETHTIDLNAPEDGAMIETNFENEEFAVSLQNCTPQVVN